MLNFVCIKFTSLDAICLLLTGIQQTIKQNRFPSPVFHGKTTSDNQGPPWTVQLTFDAALLFWSAWTAHPLERTFYRPLCELESTWLNDKSSDSWYAKLSNPIAKLNQITIARLQSAGNPFLMVYHRVRISILGIKYSKHLPTFGSVSSRSPGVYGAEASVTEVGF